MFDNQAREVKNWVLAPVAHRLRRWPPAWLTMLGLISGLATAVLAWQQLYLWAALFWALNRLLDGLDGEVARQTGTQSDFGGYLDILVDFVVYTAVPSGLTLGLNQPHTPDWLALTFLLASYYINAASWMYLAAILEKRAQGANNSGEQTTITMPTAVIGGLETTLVYFLFLLWPSALWWLYLGMGSLVFVSVGQRLWWARANL